MFPLNPTEAKSEVRLIPLPRKNQYPSEYKCNKQISIDRKISFKSFYRNIVISPAFERSPRSNLLGQGWCPTCYEVEGEKFIQCFLLNFKVLKHKNGYRKKGFLLVFYLIIITKIPQYMHFPTVFLLYFIELYTLHSGYRKKRIFMLHEVWAGTVSNLKKHNFDMGDFEWTLREITKKGPLNNSNDWLVSSNIYQYC